jgi:opacity protein-like surface antigen
MKRYLFALLIPLFCAALSYAQELMVSGGYNMPLHPFSGGDILDNSNGHATAGYHFKLDYIILKQSNLNFSVGAIYASNGVNMENYQKQYNSVYNKKSTLTLINDYQGYGLGVGILYYIGKPNSKLKGITKVGLGQMFINSIEFTTTDSAYYVKQLSNDASSTYWTLGAGIQYQVSPELSVLGFVEYMYSNVNFGSIRLQNVAGNTITLPNNNTNTQAVVNLSFNLGISYKFYSFDTPTKNKLKPAK